MDVGESKLAKQGEGQVAKIIQLWVFCELPLLSVSVAIVLAFGKQDIQPCILYKQTLMPLGWYQVVDSKTDCIGMPRSLVLQSETWSLYLL